MASNWDIGHIIDTIGEEYEESDLVESWQAEKDDVETVLSSIREDFEDEYKIEDCIAVAGSRIVLKVEDRESDDLFALKICRPFEDAINLVIKEYENIQDLYHQNLVKIFSAVEVNIKSATGEKFDIPVTVEEYIPDGLHLGGWVRNQLEEIETEKGIIDLLYELQTIFNQIVEGLYYLHQNRVFHCDLKPQNVLVVGNDPKIVDFGYSKKRVPGAEYSDQESDSKLGFTWDYAWPPLRKEIKEMESPDAAYTLEDTDFSYGRIDCYGLGRTFEESVGLVTEAREDIQEEIRNNHPEKRFQYAREAQYLENYLLLVAGRLKGDDVFSDFEENRGYITNYPSEIIERIQYPDHPYGLMEASRDLEKMTWEDLGSVAPEWDSNLPDRIRVGFTDVPFTPRIRRLYNHPILSRQSQVSQLGLVAFVYPGARHSRLEHMMGTYAQACKYIESLWTQKEDPFFRCIMTPEELMGASLGALFHDIGQYPHCHDIEDALPNFTNHEEMAQEIYETTFEIGEKSYQSLKDIVREEWSPTVANTVKKYLGNPQIGIDTADPRRAILQGIMSSSIDADKLDYVQRDSINLGVEYGARIENQRLINNLRPIVTKEDTRPSRVRMGISQKGSLPAQSLIIAREQMYERAYWHKTVRAFKAMLTTALRKEPRTSDKIKPLIKEFRSNMSTSFVKDLDISYPPESYHQVESDQSMLARLYELIDDDGSRYLIEQILQRHPYRPLLDLSAANQESPTARSEIEEAVRPLSQALEGPSYDVGFVEKTREHLQDTLLSGGVISRKDEYDLEGTEKSARDVCILIDIPSRSAFGESTVWVSGDDLGDAMEIDLSVDSGQPTTGKEWRESIVPRIYLHRAFEAEIEDPHSIADLLQDSTEKVASRPR